jgi:ferredoxin
LIYGRDDAAIEVGRRLADRLDVTVLLTEPGDATPHYSNEFPIRKGSVRNGRGHLGQFELTIDDYAFSAPSSRRRLEFGVPHNGAVSTCDLALDLSGGSPMFPAHELRPGYLRADPRDRAAVEKLIADAGHLVGTLDKPRFIELDESLCAHSRSGITGCTRCLDLCPTGAIRLTPDSIQQNMVASTWVALGCVQFLENQKRFHTAWVIRVGLAGPRRLPVYPGERTFSG